MLRAVVCCLVVVGLLLPAFAECGRPVVAVTKSVGGGGVKAVQSDGDGMSVIVAWAIWKFVEGVGWIIIGYELTRMWRYVWERDLPERIDGSVFDGDSLPDGPWPEPV